MVAEVADPSGLHGWCLIQVGVDEVRPGDLVPAKSHTTLWLSAVMRTNRPT